MPSKIEGELSGGESSIEPDPDTTINVVDEQSIKRVASLFAAGVTIVTTHHAEGLHGLTLNAFMLVSFEPPLVLISIDSLTRSAEYIGQSGGFAVSILSDRQEFLSERFAGRAPLVNRRFDGAPHHFAVTGAPILNDALGWFDCRVEQTIRAGDHTLFLGRVVALGEGPPENALVYFNRRYHALER
jgi:flavin reductase (DIM6/NTAB) family NADH-FMN oxidoreductase RutF